MTSDLHTHQPASNGRSPADEDPGEESGPHRIGRRRFIGYLLAAPTAVGAAQLGASLFRPARASTASSAAQVGSKFSPVLSNPQLADIYDLSDQLTDATLPTMNLIRVVMNGDGTASFALHRTEVGQGLSTAIAMLIAEELDLPLEKVIITHRDADPLLLFNQITAGSNSMNSLYYPVRVAAAVAKGALLEAAALELGFAANFLTSKLGIISAINGASVSYAAMAHKAAVQHMKQVAVQLKPSSRFSIVGTPTKRIDAPAIVRGDKTFTLDLVKPDAWPTMLRRPPTINGTVGSVNNAAAVKAMPGITHVVPIRTGVAVRGRTFGQVLDGLRALDVTWGPGPVDNESDTTVLQKLKAATPPMLIPVLPGAKVLETELPIAFSSNSSMETNDAIADVKAHSAEIWTSCKIPIFALQNIANHLGLSPTAVKFHVMPGGGSFGRRLFHDAALEAAEVSQKIGKPVRLMWSRTDDFRQGRVHPFSYSRIRVSYTPRSVLSFEQHHTSVRTDFSHGFGEIFSATFTRLPLAGLAVSEDIFESSQTVPYNFGPTKQVLNEIFQTSADNQPYGSFNTVSMRNVYSPDVCTAMELTIDKLAVLMGSDPYHFRRSFVKDQNFLTVLDKAAEVGGWGRSLPDGVGQGIALHREYKQTMCCFAEVDARPQTVNRKVPDGVTGPRVTRIVFVTIPGSGPVNPLGMEAQIQGGIMDGIAKALTSSMHLDKGSFLEGSWDNYFYTRQWNVPPELQVILLPGDPSAEVPGSGEAGVAASMAAVAGAYAAATKAMPAILPVNHNTLSFTPYPLEPSTPPSPDTGLQFGF